jgi:hypothetical protein
MNPTMSDNTTSSTAPLDRAPPSTESTKFGVNGSGFARNNIGGNDGPIINVEPPRREDLQPSYAQNLVGESEQGTHGWYGSMSMSFYTLPTHAAREREKEVDTETKRGTSRNKDGQDS